MDENDESLVFVTFWDCQTHVPMTSSVERTDLDFKISVALVYTVCHSVCIVWTHYSMVEPHNSNFRVITTNILGVRISRKFTLFIFMVHFVAVVCSGLTSRSQRCLVATGSSMLTFIVLPHWCIMPQTLDMIPHPVTLSWHWVDQSYLHILIWVPSEKQLVPFLTTLLCLSPGSKPRPSVPWNGHSTYWTIGADSIHFFNIY